MEFELSRKILHESENGVSNRKWQAFVDDIRTSLLEEADDIAARLLGLRLIGALPPAVRIVETFDA
jgi:hypothetical protein